MLVKEKALSRALLLLLRHRSSRHDAPQVAGMSRADGYIFAAWEKRVFAYAYSFCLSGSLPDRGLLNRLERVRRGRPTFVRVRVSRAALYIIVRRVAIEPI